MKILLDTHMIIWALTNSSKLPQKAKELILQPENDIYFSVISLWEIEIKRLAKADSLPITAQETSDYCKQAGFQLISLQESSIYRLQELFRPENEKTHKDPFDRMLICQAVSYDMKFLTHDSLIKGYVFENILFF